MTWTRASRYTIQSLSMPRLWIRPKISGLCRASQRSRAGEVIDTQSPPSAKIRSAAPSLIRSAASCAARLSTFGQAHISAPVASNSTISSRMLVAATAATSFPVAPARRRASRMQAAIASQLASTSKSWPPGTPGGSRWVHSGRDPATCSPATVKSSARQLPVPASTASR